VAQLGTARVSKAGGQPLSRPIGLVVADVSDASPQGIRKIVNLGIEKVPAGRDLVVIWSVPSEWGTRVPVEAIATEIVMGDPMSRGDVTTWSFFGNGIVRTYGKSNQVPSECWSWLIFRRHGPRVYELRSQLSKEVLDNSRIPTSDAVFTRDVANNVWHLPNQGAKGAIIRRFQALLSWSHESCLVINATASRRNTWRSWNSARELVGKPIKVRYDFISPTLF